jgi:hypothetical protein
VEVNAGSYGSSSILSRLGDEKMLSAPQSICALTRCMLPCIVSSMVGFLVSAAAASALPVCLLAFVDFLHQQQP